MAENADCSEADWSADSVQVIEAYVESVQNRDWSTFIESEFSGERESFRLYFADDSNMNGIKQVEEISLINIYEVDSSVAEGELLKREYPILAENDTVRSYIVALDCTVNRENHYFFNGVNYFLAVLAEENGEMKIVQFNRPSAAMLEQVVMPALTMARKDSSDSVGGISTCASGKDDLPTLSSYEYYSYPSTITDMMDKTGNNEILTVDFETYIKTLCPMNGWESGMLSP